MNYRVWRFDGQRKLVIQYALISRRQRAVGIVRAMAFYRCANCGLEYGAFVDVERCPQCKKPGLQKFESPPQPAPVKPLYAFLISTGFFIVGAIAAVMSGAVPVGVAVLSTLGIIAALAFWSIVRQITGK